VKPLGLREKAEGLGGGWGLQKGGDKLGYESEAFAIYDTMRYIKPPIHTLCVGNAFGEAAFLLSAGVPVRAPPLSRRAEG
jgi:ATP-dependent protease ClpP protease subunit